MELSLEELTKFGIRPEDEGPHPHSPDQEWWNESVFFDWFDERGENAGHCRIGIHPNQRRVWLWLFLYNGDEWVAIEEPRLPLSDLKLPEIAYDRWGLAFSWTVLDPLRRSRLRCSGFGRVVSGTRVGMILPVSVDLEFEALGAAHSVGQHVVEGHADARLSASRFEQPVWARGRYAIDAEARPFTGRGERDHSWGPRWWTIEWTFLVLNGAPVRLQCARVRIPDVSEITVGYLHRDSMISLSDATFDFAYDDERVTSPVAGPFRVRAEDGSVVAGTVVPLTGTEIDITHCFVPPRRSVYRRALVRCTLEGSGPPVLGWVESNRFVERA